MTDTTEKQNETSPKSNDNNNSSSHASSNNNGMMTSRKRKAEALKKEFSDWMMESLENEATEEEVAEYVDALWIEGIRSSHSFLDELNVGEEDCLKCIPIQRHRRLLKRKCIRATESKEEENNQTIASTSSSIINQEAADLLANEFQTIVEKYQQARLGKEEALQWLEEEQKVLSTCYPSPSIKAAVATAYLAIYSGYTRKKCSKAKKLATQAIYLLSSQEINPFMAASTIIKANVKYLLGEFMLMGYGVDKEEKQGFQLIVEATNYGLVTAQFRLGYCYHHGIGVAHDEMLAVEWYMKAAEKGDAIAQNNLGLCYDRGQGVAQNYPLAVDWYRRAAIQGCSAAQYNLGVAYERGNGVAENHSLAVEWYRKSAENGDVDAQYKLGLSYYNGKGVDQDFAVATEWFRRAAVQGHSKAQYHHDLCLYIAMHLAKEWYLTNVSSV